MTHNESDAAVIIECELPESREQVWKALTVPELLARWLMLPEDGSIECAVLEAEPQRRLRLSWRESQRIGQPEYGNTVHSVVTFDLGETLTGGTHLRLVHEGFEVRQTRAVATQVIQLEPHRTRRMRKPVASLCCNAIQLRRAA